MTAQVAIYIDPPTDHFLDDRLFDSSVTRYGGDDLLAPYRALRDHFGKAGVPVHTADRFDPGAARTHVYCAIGRAPQLARVEGRDDCVASGFFALECPIVEPTLYTGLPKLVGRFRRIWSWSDTRSLLPFTRRPVPTHHFCWPQSFDAVHEEIWGRGDRKFLVMMNTNKLPRLYVDELYTKRLEAVEYFHRFGEVDLFGRYWDEAPRRVGKTWVPATARRVMERAWEVKQALVPDPRYAACAGAYRGVAESKSETLAGYRFALCFENQVLKGWITEKIFDCFFAGTVPIYWGSPDIQDWVPPECFIDYRTHGSLPRLRDFLHSLSDADVEGYREAARSYLASERFDPFRASAFVDKFRMMVEEDAGLAL